MNGLHQPRMRLRLCVLALIGAGLLLPVGGAQAAPSGTVVAWGCAASYYDFGQCAVPAGLTDVSAIAAGYFHSLAVSGGAVVAFGCGGGNDYGQCTVPGDLTGVTAVAANLYSLALKSDGTVVAWGCGGFNVGECDVGGLSGVRAISAGFGHSLALKTDGTVVATGCGGTFDFGQCSVPSGLSGVSAIAAGTYHSLALKTDGTVVAWGCSPFGGDFGQCNVPDWAVRREGDCRDRTTQRRREGRRDGRRVGLRRPVRAVPGAGRHRRDDVDCRGRLRQRCAERATARWPPGAARSTLVSATSRATFGA